MRSHRWYSRIGLTASLAIAGAGATVPTAASAATGCNHTPIAELTEGPFYMANPPKRQAIAIKGTVGQPLLVTGRVLTTRCTPLAGARVDFWQADGAGNYDNSGYRLRGYQTTDAQGRYRLTTVVAGLYPGRTEHIHVKVTPKGGQTTTTQLFFPGVTQNGEDGIFSKRMLMTLKKGSPRWTATFDFVVSA
jgi:protocatechuate 3,4-dioxygenase beta subunit